MLGLTVFVRALVVPHDLNVRIQIPESVFGTIELGATDVGRPVEELTLEVALVDGIEIDEADGSDTRGCQIHGERRTESTRPHAQDARLLEPPLTVETDVG